jgi:hypothetical protein
MPAIISRARLERHNVRRIEHVKSLLAAATPAAGQIPTTAHVDAIRQLAEVGAVDNYAWFLPIVFQLNGIPYSIDNYKQFSPMFDTEQPGRQLWKTARQVAKTTSTAASSLLVANNRPYTTTLFVAPRYEQIRRISGNVVRPFIENSPLVHQWTSTSTEKSVLQKTFKNGSKHIFSFALLDADRTRGVAADWVRYDEIQDINPDHLPIIRECTSASKLAIQTFTGTPLTLSNTIETLWQDSSQAEWFIPCLACNHINIPSIEHDLLKMIGPYREDISPHRPGIICARCHRPVFPEHGRWVHKFHEKALRFAGYHISQPIMHLHYSDKNKWLSLLEKQNSNSVAPYVFTNEVLGESAATGNQLLTLPELLQSCRLPWDNSPNSPDPEILWRIHNNRYVVMALGVDWGGGGVSGVSYTTLSLLGYLSDGTIDVCWGKRLLTPNDHLREAAEVWHWVRYFNVRIMAHDYTGAGVLRESYLVQAGFPVGFSMPMQYVGSATRSLINYVEPTPEHQRAHYRLDKTRSLLTTLTGIKTGRIRFFRDDYKSGENAGLVRQFLALQDEKRESERAGDIYLITRLEGQSDDFAHATNLGASALYHVHKSWPDLSQIYTGPVIEPLTDAQLRAFGHGGYGWEQDDELPSFLRRP